jgi:hypothetical protein
MFGGMLGGIAGSLAGKLAGKMGGRGLAKKPTDDGTTLSKADQGSKASSRVSMVQKKMRGKRSFSLR